MRIPNSSFFSEQQSLISDQYERLNILYQKQTKQTKILNAAEDPVLASQIQATKDFLGELSTYNQTQTLAKNRNQLFESSTTDAVDAVKVIQQDIMQLQGGTLNDSQRADVAQGLQTQMQLLIRAANTQDADGQYIYSGYNSSAEPFAFQHGSYQYQGGYNQTTIDIGPSTSVVYNDVGANVFGNIPLGNGTFAVTATSTNTGSAYSTAGSVVNPSAYVADTYTVSFMTNSSNQLVYVVTGAASGQLIPSPSTSLPDGAPVYKSGQDITFNGMTIAITGTPNVNDTFQIAPSQKQDVFDTLQNIINAALQPIASNGVVDPTKSAQLNQALNNAAASFSQVLTQFTGYLSQVGLRSQQIQNEIDTDNSLITNQNITLHEMQDADMPKLTSDISEQLASLQLTQETYTQIQKTLLDLYKIT